MMVKVLRKMDAAGYGEELGLSGIEHDSGVVLLDYIMRYLVEDLQRIENKSHIVTIKRFNKIWHGKKLMK
jgi:hypothetical protein